MASDQTPNEFYAERGLVRTSTTLSPEHIQFLADKSKELSDEQGFKITQGEVLSLLLDILQEDQHTQAEFVNRLNQFVEVKMAERNRLRERKKKARELLKSGKLDHLL